ncbi:MAG: low molecular weight protein-tyrosine-phosphatase [Myxococcota bacterium]
MTSVLFVCLGNICRSPTAEGVVRHRIEARQLDDRVEVDSAGTVSHHRGEPADARMREHASRRGYTLTSRARRVEASDFARFDMVVAMDAANHADLLELSGGDPDGKIVRFCDFVPGRAGEDVPDPYYGGPEGFEEVLDLIEAGADPLLDRALEPPD